VNYYKISKILKLDIKDLADNSSFRNNLIEYYHQQSDSQLQKIKSGAVDSKLILFSNIFIPNFVPFYLETVHNLQNRSSLGILGLLYLPRSIFKQ
jgi:hypothetical protein